MLDTWEQRVARDEIVLKKISFPVPPPSLADLVAALRAGDHAAHEGDSRLPHHESDRADFPGARHLPSWRARAASPTIVDGAHAYGQFPFTVRDLECDFYGTSLHKWLLAPVGTGFLYVRAGSDRRTLGR